MEDRIIEIPIHTVKPHPRNEEFFDNVDGETFDRLKESIAEVGLLTPIRISKDYTIISGHQRYRACLELGVEFIHAIVDNELEDENEMLMQLIVSNFGRVKNDPIKQGELIAEYERLRGVAHGGDRKSKSSGNNSRLIQEDLAKEFGCDVTTLRNLKRLTKLPPEIQEIIRSGKLSPTTAVKVIAPLPLEDQIKLIQSLPEAAKHLTQAAVQQQVDKLRAASMEAQKAAERAEEAEARALAIQQDTDAQLQTANESMCALQAKLDEAQQQLAESPREVEITPPDYAELKAKAARCETMELENAVLRERLQAHEAKPAPPPPPDTPKAIAEALWADAGKVSQHAQTLLENQGIIQGIDIGVRERLAERVYEIVEDLTRLCHRLQSQ